MVTEHRTDLKQSVGSKAYQTSHFILSFLYMYGTYRQKVS
jgi:hypothetical protein